MLRYALPLSHLKVMDEASKAIVYTESTLSWMQQPSSFSLLTRHHPQYELVASPATRFSGSGRGRQRAKPSSLITTHSTVHPGRKEGRRRTSVKSLIHECWCALLGSSCLFLLPVCISVCVSDRPPWLWWLFFCVFGGRSSAGWERGGAGPRVLWGELRFASEGVSVLGRWRGVTTAQGDQQRRGIVSSNPFIGLQRRL